MMVLRSTSLLVCMCYLFLGKYIEFKTQVSGRTPHFPIMSASGCKENFTYEQDLTPSKKVRQRKIIWFNPPYSVNVKTNIGKTFLKLFDKHFRKTNKFHKIFMSKLAAVVYQIKSHNNRILSEEKTQDQPKCNC